MTARTRWILWLAALIGAIALVVLDSNEPPPGAIVEVASPRARVLPQPAAESQGSSQDAMILAVRPRSAPSDAADAFAVRDWSPPQRQAAKPPPAPPPPPSAPPFPYTFFGKKLEDGVWQVFLRRDERILVVKTLDTIDNAYRVDEIRPPVMTVTYLSLQQQQTLSIGGAE